MSSLKVWIDLDTGARIGHGKIDLLEKIAALGSISAAGRALGMSYRRAWELVEETSGIFGEAITQRQVGGRGGGGATLTPLGLTLVSRYRSRRGRTGKRSLARQLPDAHAPDLQAPNNQAPKNSFSPINPPSRTPPGQAKRALPMWVAYWFSRSSFDIDWNICVKPVGGSRW